MLDPFPLRNPPSFQALAKPIAARFDLQTLPQHMHEVLFAFALYQAILSFFSPVLSRLLFPRAYGKLSARTRLNWDVHVVAFVQSIIISGMGIWNIVNDQERRRMDWHERIYGYTGALGLVQAFATGYFLWDLYVCVRYYSMFGFGMFAHAITSLAVYAFGFRPFANYYAANFVLYELSSPFLNLHWFCDKLDLTGSVLQMVNGVLLLLSFAGCRLIYGSYASLAIYKDMYTALRHARASPHTPPLALSPFALNATTLFNNPAEALEVVRFARLQPGIPAWIVWGTLVSNVTSNILNWYWYGQMIAAIRKRFDPPFGTRRKEKDEDEDVSVSRGQDAQGRKTVTADSTQTQLRKRPVEAFKRLQTSEMPPSAA